MSAARFIIGDVRAVLDNLEAGSVDLIMSSPPFIGQREYLRPDDPLKPFEIGREPNPAEFITVLLDWAARCRRVLAPHGSFVVELGDTYAGSGGAGGDYYNEDGWRAGQPKPKGSASLAAGRAGVVRQARKALRVPGQAEYVRPISSPGGDGWPDRKSAALIPELFRVALAYGRHPLTGEVSPAGRWKIRNTVTWCRRNPTPGALGDKWRPATSDIVVACTADDRWWDEVATRRPATGNAHPRVAKGAPARKGDNTIPSQARGDGSSASRGGSWSTLAVDNKQFATAPLLDWWDVSAGGYAGAHFAVWPPELLGPIIDSMCPERVCTTCGEPSRLLVETTTTEVVRDGNGPAGYRDIEESTLVDKQVIGHTICGHGTWRRGVVLDPFGGSGTTAVVATGHGRDAILIDINADNAELALDRVGPLLLSVEQLGTVTA